MRKVDFTSRIYDSNLQGRVMSNFQRIRVVMRLMAAAALSLIAAFSASAQTVRYVHTDGLGSSVLMTDKDRNVIERSEYEPYGSLLNRPISDGPGYAGHVMDAATGLTYMQQRYYDPQIGRFLSIDPLDVNSETGANFGRYWYANNNPYRFNDPDGRETGAVFSTLDRAERKYGQKTSGTSLNEEQVGLIVDFMPVFGDAKAIAEAVKDPTAVNIASAGVSLLGPIGDVAGKGIKSAKAVGKVENFDAARRAAFKSAGMEDPSKVIFSKMDEATGTVVEFKGEGGAKIGYDGPHASPGPYHDSQHISWQTGGKRQSGGTQRGNIPYSGERHPSRPDRKDQ